MTLYTYDDELLLKHVELIIVIDGHEAAGFVSMISSILVQEFSRIMRLYVDLIIILLWHEILQ